MMDLRRLRNTLLYRIWHGFSEKGNIIYFFSQTFTIHRTAGEGGGYFFNPSLPLSLAGISREITAGGSPLHIVSSQN